ncbi:MAG: hypothetical protein IJ268_08955 [Proteobacteria bacterium]|nr:hypothetical protein [Pseudomonadota bacterium]
MRIFSGNYLQMAIWALLAMLLPGLSFAEGADSESLAYAEEDLYQAGDDSQPEGFWRNGFALSAGGGLLVAPIHAVSSGYRYFPASSIGPLAYVDIGYNWDFFTLSLEISPHAGWLYKDAVVTDSHHTYVALEKGRWDGYFLSLALKFDFAIRMTDSLFMSLGFGFDLAMGMAVTREVLEAQFRLDGSIGIYHLISDHLAMGFKLMIGGNIGSGEAERDGVLHDSDHSAVALVPAFSLIYHP